VQLSWQLQLAFVQTCKAVNVLLLAVAEVLNAHAYFNACTTSWLTAFSFAS
jgi:hypothetical protein